jgi:hypothetical protein
VRLALDERLQQCIKRALPPKDAIGQLGGQSAICIAKSALAKALIECLLDKSAAAPNIEQNLQGE